MNQWIQIEIPYWYIQEEIVKGSGAYAKTYFSIILPQGEEQYKGYHCLINIDFFIVRPVMYSKNDSPIAIAKLPIDMLVIAEKKEKEKGKRYKRYKFTVDQFNKLYEAEIVEINKKYDREKNKFYSQTGEIVFVQYPEYARECFIGMNYEWGIIRGKWFYKGGDRLEDKKRVSAGNFKINETLCTIQMKLLHNEEYWKCIRDIVKLANTKRTLAEDINNKDIYQDMSNYIDKCIEKGIQILRSYENCEE